MTDATNNANANNASGNAKTKTPEQGFFSKAWGTVSKTVSEHRAKIAFIGGAVSLYGVAAAVDAYRKGSAAEEAAASQATDGSSNM